MYKNAFTLVEILVVIAILASLAVIAFVIINPISRINSAQETSIQKDLESAGKGLQLYMIDNAGEIPLRDSGSASQIETVSWVHTQNIDVNSCIGNYELSNYDNALRNKYIETEVLEAIEHNYRVVFTPEGGVFICREDSDPLLYIFY